MFFYSEEVESMMNGAGARRVPFLFGVDFELENGFFIENPISQQDILFEVEGIGNINREQINKRKIKDYHNNFQLEIFPEEPAKYNQRFQKVMEGLTRGDSYLTNLTIKTPIKSSLSLKEICLLSSSPYKIYIPNKLVCFSPECFVKISDGQISTFPMKGTIDATTPNAKEIILNNDKETAEHNTIVDLLRNDLASVADNVTLKRFRYIDILNGNRGNLLQVSSEIEGSLNGDYLNNIGSIIFKLLPAGSVSGAPKRATLNIICEAEQEKRGFYTGIAGYFDGNSINSFVLIRFIEQENNRLFFRSGGGITAMSDSNMEYSEVLQKVYLPF